MSTVSNRAGERDRGAVMVELALVLPILLMLLVGIMQFGLAYNANIRIEAGAREGARSLALRDSTTTVQSAVRSVTGTTPVTITQTACPSSTTSSSTSFATVVVTSTYRFDIPFITLGQRTLRATASMRCGL